MVSVVIPVYNGAKYIEKTIRTILNSTYQNLEIIAVVDGSPDNSLAVCQKLSQEDARVKTFYKDNGGIPDARNYGIERATGEYICVCDQDDLVQPAMYEHMVERLDAEKADLCFCSTGQMVNGSVVPFESFEDATFTEDEIRTQL